MESIWEKEYKDYIEENKEYYSLYQPRYYELFCNDPDVQELKRRHQADAENRRNKENERKQEMQQKIEKKSQRGAILASAAGLCAGMIVGSAFFLGAEFVIIFIIWFVIFGCCFKGSEKKKQALEQELRFPNNDYDSKSRILWTGLKEGAQIRVLLVKKAIESGIIKGPSSGQI